jgi:hypothetical protein
MCCSVVALDAGGFNMDGLTHLNQFMNIATAKEKRKKTMDTTNHHHHSPWSSGSGSTSPLPSMTTGQQTIPNRLNLFDKSYSGGSTCSLGSSPGTDGGSNKHFLTGQTSLTVPDLNLPVPLTSSGSGKVNRSTSPFNFKSGRNKTTKKDKKKLEKQSNCLEEPRSSNSHRLLSLSSSQSSYGTSLEGGDPAEPSKPEPAKPSTKNPFKEFRRKRKDHPFSLSLMRKKSTEKQHHEIPCTASTVGHLLHPDSSLTSSFGDNLSAPDGTSPPCGGSSPRSLSRSPPSPSPSSQCKCRRCSILHLEECEPKEMNALFKFLRKSKV